MQELSRTPVFVLFLHKIAQFFILFFHCRLHSFAACFFPGISHSSLANEHPQKHWMLFRKPPHRATTL